MNTNIGTRRTGSDELAKLPLSFQSGACPRIRQRAHSPQLATESFNVLIGDGNDKEVTFFNKT